MHLKRDTRTFKSKSKEKSDRWVVEMQQADCPLQRIADKLELDQARVGGWLKCFVVG